jgi:hypothetical protein
VGYQKECQERGAVGPSKSMPFFAKFLNHKGTPILLANSKMPKFVYPTCGLDHGVGHPSCLVILTLVVGLSDCTGISQTEQSALSGGAMRVVGGALLGALVGNAGMRAAIGGEGGLTGDYLYGKPKEAEQ